VVESATLNSKLAGLGPMFLVMTDGQEVGRSPLDVLDDSMGVAMGMFTPSSGYDRVRDVFRRLSDACAAGKVPQALWEERDALALTIVDPNGKKLSVDWVMIYDYGVDDERELHVNLLDLAEFEAAFASGGAG
jgi:hypothetical protein